jgi:hypothetical protein
MKYPVYLRVAKTDSRKGYKVAASGTPNNEPLSNGQKWALRWYPTLAFCVNIEIPDELFEQSQRVIAELNVGMKAAQVTSEIVLPKGITTKGSKSKTKK